MNLVRMIRVFLTVLYRLIGHCVQTIRPIRTPSPRLKNDRGQSPLRFTFSPFLLLLSLSFYACPVPPTEPPQNTTITLEEISTGITGTTLKVAVEDTTAEWTLTLTRNDSVLLIQKTVYQKDTLITDDGLNPATQYNYRAYWMDGNTRKDSSNLVSIMTGDTTSHDFFWEIDTLGENGSYLNDVEIVNENDIWVVGNIVTDTAPYNAAHWDGNEWELKGIYSNTLDLYSIQYFNENDIWVTDICSPIHWDGNEWTLYHLQNMGLDVCVGNAIWGTSSSNMYFVGNSGSIVHYDGVDFIEMESGTEVDLLSIDGTSDGEYVFITGYTNMFGVTASIALELVQNQISILSYTDFHEPGSEEFGRIWSCHVLEDTVYFATGGGLWKYNYLSHSSLYLTNDKVNMGYRAYSSIGANGVNDIIFFGSGMTYVHYNGSTWYRDERFYPGHNFIFKSGELKEDLAVMVGFMVEGIFWQGIVTRGFRNQ